MAAPAKSTPSHTALRVVPRGESERASVALLDADPDFAEAIPAGDRVIAAGVGLPVVALEAGTAWERPAEPDDAVASLVVSGFLLRTLRRYGRSTIEMYGPGDLIAPEALISDGATTWKVVDDSTIARLDQRFEIAARRWPALWRVTLQRSSERSERLAAHLAALQLSRVDDRVEAVLWQLADRFGRVTPEGVVLPMALTHQAIGHLAAAKRPTVSVALGQLAAEGRVVRLPDGGWLLRRAGFGLEAVAAERREATR